MLRIAGKHTYRSEMLQTRREDKADDTDPLLLDREEERDATDNLRAVESARVVLNDAERLVVLEQQDELMEFM